MTLIFPIIVWDVPPNLGQPSGIPARHHTCILSAARDKIIARALSTTEKKEKQNHEVVLSPPASPWTFTVAS